MVDSLGSTFADDAAAGASHAGGALNVKRTAANRIRYPQSVNPKRIAAGLEDHRRPEGAGAPHNPKWGRRDRRESS